MKLAKIIKIWKEITCRSASGRNAPRSWSFWGFCAGGTQKLELLGFSTLEVPRSRHFWGFLLEVDPEAGAFGRDVSWWDPEAEASRRMAFEGIQKMELLDMILPLGVQKLELLEAMASETWNIKKHYEFWEKAGFEPVPSRMNVRCLCLLSQPALVLDI